MSITFVRAFTDNYVWVLDGSKGQSVLCVDPGDANPVLHYLKSHQLKLDTILLTHHHADHVGGTAELIKHHPEAKVYGPNDSRIPVTITPVHEPDKLVIHNYLFRILNIPGHTSSHICFHETNFGWLFCGDTLFSAGCGRIFDGSPELLHESLLKIKALPDETKIFCGHEYTRQNLRFAATVEPENHVIQQYSQRLASTPDSPSLPSTIALEKQINPFLRLSEPAVIQYAQQRGCTQMDSLTVFKQLRRDKDVFQ